MLQKSHRLKKGFGTVLKNGKRIRSAYTTIVYQVNTKKPTRIGILLSKKLGKAYVRNKVKRRIYAIMKEHADILAKNVDIVVIPSKFIHDWKHISYQTLKDDLFNYLGHI